MNSEMNPGRRNFLLGTTIFGLGAAMGAGGALASREFGPNLGVVVGRWLAESPNNLLYKKYGVKVETGNIAGSELPMLIEPALKKVPYARTLAPKIVVERNFGGIGGGFWGRGSLGPEAPATVKISLPYDFRPNEKKEIDPSSSPFGLAADRISQLEALHRAITHEYGHAFDDAVVKVAGRKEERGKNNIVLSTFANLVGWQWGNLGLYQWEKRERKGNMDMYLTRAEMGEGWINPWVEVKIEEGWFTDLIDKLLDYPYSSVMNNPRVSPWATLPGYSFITNVIINKEIRPGPETRGEPFVIIPNKIEETFAEFWVAYHFRQDLLTKDEIKYLDNIHKGLLSGAEKFIEKVAQNPDILLAGVNLPQPAG